LITPLKKCNAHGELYLRRPEIEKKIGILALLSYDEIISQGSIQQESDLEYIPSECLLYFIRDWRKSKPSSYYKKLYELLLARVSSYVRNAENGQTILIKNAILEKVSEGFISLLIDDPKDCLYRLDYYELNFNHALKNLRLSAWRQIGRDKNASTTTLYEKETGELKAEVEHAAGSYDLFNSSNLSSKDYRIDLDEAINTLEPIERQIIIMYYIDGFSIDSQDPNEITIAKVIGKYEKTVRTYRDKALKKLRIALNGEN
jgi:Sigma-70, region 4